MGTPDFAVGILDTIIKHNYEIVGIITAPDKPAGRGQKLKLSAVKQYALDNSLQLLQPTNLKDESFLQELQSLQANLQVIVAFRMLPKVVWSMPALGTFNLHASLLPQYRGAAPINWAIINGETKTGVTSFFIDDKIDTGAMITRKEINLSSTENAGTLHDRLMLLGAETVIETLQLIENDSVQTTIQPQNTELKTAHKLNKENCKIDFNKPGIEIYNLIRGLSPYPAAWFNFVDGDAAYNVKVYEANYTTETHNYPIGTIIASKNQLKVAINFGFIEILSLQFPGKKQMQTKEALNGLKISETAVAY